MEIVELIFGSKHIDTTNEKDPEVIKYNHEVRSAYERNAPYITKEDIREAIKYCIDELGIRPKMVPGIVFNDLYDCVILPIQKEQQQDPKQIYKK